MPQKKIIQVVYEDDSDDELSDYELEIQNEIIEEPIIEGSIIEEQVIEEPVVEEPVVEEQTDIKFVGFTIPRIETFRNAKGEEKKKPIGMPSDWNNKVTAENYKTFINPNHQVRCLLTGKKSNIIVIDFDDTESYEKLKNDYPNITRHKTIKTRRGFHIYCNYDANILTTTNGLLNYKNVDIASDGHNVFCPPSYYFDLQGNRIEYEDLGGDILDIPNIIKNDMKQFNSTSKPSNKEFNFVITSETEKLLKNEGHRASESGASENNAEEYHSIINKFIDNDLLKNTCDTHQSWVLIATHLKVIFEENITLFQKLTEKYGSDNKKEEHEKWWNEYIKPKYDDKAKAFNIIKKLAKETDKDKFNEVMKLINISYYISIKDLEDVFQLSKIISKTLKDNLILCEEKWYMLTDNNLWRQQKEPTFYISNEIRKYIDYSNKQIVNKLADLVDETERNPLIEQSKKYLQFYKTVSTTSFINVMTKYLKTLLVDNNFANKLNATPNIMAFKNGIVDLRTKQFRKGILSSDFITETIQYDYTPCNLKKKDFVKSVLKKILNNNEEHLEYYLSIIGYSFIGSPNLEKSIYFMIDKTENSKGDNGKTFWFDILTSLMPNYVYKSKASFIEKTNTKVHKQLVMTKSKRLVWLEEYPKDKEVNSDLTKEIADGNKIENEVMFGTSETLNILFKMFVLSNNIPKIEATENAVYNRYKQVSYNSHFDRTGERLVEEPDKLLFIADTTLGDIIKNEYYDEVFDLIIEYANKYYDRKIPKIPNQFIKDANDTKKTNDTFASWFDDNCEINLSGKIALKKLVTESGMNEKLVKEGMMRKGFKYKKDLRGLGKDQFDKAYKGGFEGVLFVENEDIDTDQP